MLTLINANRISPLIAPIGLEYAATAARRAGITTEVLDLALAADPEAALRAHFASASPRLVGVSFRNVDDSFWPSGQWFLPALADLVQTLRGLTDAPIVLGGVGFSIFPDRIVQFTGADFGIHGDGETGLTMLYEQLAGHGRFETVPGLIWRTRGNGECSAGQPCPSRQPPRPVISNPPAWPLVVNPPTDRDAIDNAAYFRLGGQGGVETKRGCPRRCIYCADPLSKGRRHRLRSAGDVANEVESLARQGVDVLHLCDGEFNIPRTHAAAVCEEFIRRGLGHRVRWYAYMAVEPFDAELAAAIRRAGCVGIDFTGDAGCDDMLRRYGHGHLSESLASAVRLCREHGIATMVDLLLGGPGETPQTLRQTIDFLKTVGPDCVGAAMGMRLYPGTQAERIVRNAGSMKINPSIRRRYDGPVDLLRPTFYVSADLGESPAALAREFIGHDQRFFPPADEPGVGEDHNYNDNAALTAAIAAGARGAYWDILRKM